MQIQTYLLGLFTFALTSMAEPQAYPFRPVVIIAPFAAGSPVDSVGRVIVERMRSSLGQPVVIENVTGGAGSVGAGRVAQAFPDGYTISIGNLSSHVLNGAIYPLSFDVLTSFEPIALLASNPQVLLGKKDMPAKDLRALLGWLKAHPDRATAGTGGIGGVSHVAGVFFQRETNTRFRFVPYRGTNLAQQDLVGGHIDLLFEQAVNAVPNVRAGRIRAYAVTASSRLRSAPDIPTVDEAGLPGFYISVWNALWAPKGTQRDVISKLNAAVVTSLADPAVRQRFSDLGLDIPPRDQQTAEHLGAFHKSEVDRWWPIVKAAQIKVE